MSERWHATVGATRFLSSVLADLGLWIRFLQKEVMAQGVLGRAAPVPRAHRGRTAGLNRDCPCYRGGDHYPRSPQALQPSYK